LLRRMVGGVGWDSTLSFMFAVDDWWLCMGGCVDALYT
jgi:hypothetical protein